MINMACTLFRLTPEEAWRGVTVHAARALGLADRGRLASGQRADFVVWDAGSPARDGLPLRPQSLPPRRGRRRPLDVT
jgi:imidazolonepropionase-like amidohydrolase